MHVKVRFDLREIEDTGEVERIIHIQMDMEQRLLHLGRIQLMIEFIIILIRQIRRFARPGRIDIVNDILLVEFYFFTVFPFFFLAESNLHRQEFAVFAQQSFDRCILKVLRKLIVYMQHYIRSALRFDGILHRIFRIALAGPVDGFRIFLIRLAEDFHFLANHKSRIETETEMADDRFGFIFVFVDKFLGAGESDLVDVFVHLFGGHAYTMVRNGERLLLLINRHAHAKVA